MKETDKNRPIIGNQVRVYRLILTAVLSDYNQKPKCCPTGNFVLLENPFTQKKWLLLLDKKPFLTV